MAAFRVRINCRSLAISRSFMHRGSRSMRTQRSHATRVSGSSKPTSTAPCPLQILESILNPSAGRDDRYSKGGDQSIARRLPDLQSQHKWSSRAFWGYCQMAKLIGENAMLRPQIARSRISMVDLDILKCILDHFKAG